jgi:Surface adhesin CshA repetitive domain
VFKKFILGSLLVAGLTACPIEPIVPPQPASPKAVDDPQSINPITTSSTTIRPADNDIFDSSASRVLSSIDLDASKGSQQVSYDDSTGKGTFSLNTSTGVVTFKPNAGKTGIAVARYTIKDTNGNVSNPAKIEVTISTFVPTGPIKVLFIGNSRTWYTPCTSGFTAYNIPTMVQSMSVNESRPLEATVVTDCGFTLSQHWITPGDAKAPVATKGWEYVVLQAATNETDTGAQSGTRSLIQQYKAAVIAANPNAKIVLYENWSLINAPADQSRLTAFYQLAADDVGAKIAPVGRAWRQGSFSELQLFNTDGDGKHATTLGAYIAASTFYSLFYGKQAPAATGVPGTILTSEASTARGNAFTAYSIMNVKYK